MKMNCPIDKNFIAFFQTLVEYGEAEEKHDIKEQERLFIQAQTILEKHREEGEKWIRWVDGILEQEQN
ncbi:MAG: hypothetical protein ACLRVT_07485 [Oscillospiraceae bacterium]